MEGVLEWLPRIGLAITFLIGVLGLVKPEMLVGAVGIEMPTDGAKSEIRAVFGGIHLGYTIPAFYYNDPMAYMIIGYLWLGVTLSRIYSVIADKAEVKTLFPAIVVDGVIAALLLSVCFSAAA